MLLIFLHEGMHNLSKPCAFWCHDLPLRMEATGCLENVCQPPNLLMFYRRLIIRPPIDIPSDPYQPSLVSLWGALQKAIEFRFFFLSWIK